MAVCPICGCKTEELDFVARKFRDENFKVCSFCNRQLNVFDTEAEATEAQLRWLDAVISKDVAERQDNIITALKDIRGRFAKEEISQPAIQSTPQKINVVQNVATKKPVAAESDDEIIRDLQKRISGLEAEIRNMKRKQMIKSIIELGAPVVLLIILLIIFFSSGFIDNIKAIFDMAGIAL